MKNAAAMQDNVQTLLDRARIYSFLSALFSDPSTGRFRQVKNADLQATLLDACSRLASRYDGKQAGQAADRLMDALESANLSQVQEEFIRIFGHTLSKEIAPYEMEYLKNQEVFAITQGLADISGFYAAFGLHVDAAERVDHIAIQAEFLACLILKEAIAIENHLGEEQVDVCRKAQQDFLREHFLWWAARFASGLSEHVSASFYRCAGNFLLEFLKTEHHDTAG
ncbi:MAG TPA: molecular chaperone TorD family protein [Acidobacteriota bacterium]|nr:molecular chaperone TorD family protein [Acidobacteriota bacterium]